MENKKTISAKLLAVAALVALGGCATPKAIDDVTMYTPRDCTSVTSCQVEVSLPGITGQPKMADDFKVLKVRSEDEIVFELCRPGTRPCRPVQGDVFLVFPGETPFRAKEGPPHFGQPMYVVSITGGRGQLRTRPKNVCDDTGLCKDICTEGDECKYMIVEQNNPIRPPLDPWIILH